MKVVGQTPHFARVDMRRDRTPSGAWRSPPARVTTDARNVRRPSTLPRRLVWGRLVRGFALLGLAALAALGVVQVAAWVEHSRALPVRTVAVHAAPSGGAHTELSPARVAEVLAYAGVTPGDPLFAVDVDAVAKRVLEHPYVAQATVRRVPPDGVEIAIEQREPAAVLSAGGLYLLDAHAHVMKGARAGDGLDLPVVTGIAAADVASGAAAPSIARAVELLRAHAQAGAPGGAASEVALVAGVGFELVLADGTRVRLGTADFAGKLVRLDAVLRRLAADGRRASFIDLDDGHRPERAAVRLRPSAETRSVGG